MLRSCSLIAPKGVLAALLGFSIFGGVKRITTFAGIVVPFMALAYILLGLVTVALNIGQVPA